MSVELEIYFLLHKLYRDDVYRLSAAVQVLHVTYKQSALADLLEADNNSLKKASYMISKCMQVAISFSITSSRVHIAVRQCSRLPSSRPPW